MEKDMEITSEAYQQIEAAMQQASDAFYEAREAFRKATVAGVCDYVAACWPSVVKVELTPDVDWEWTLSRFLDAAGEEVEIDHESDEHETFHDLFADPLDKLPTGDRANYGYIDRPSRTFTVHQYRQPEA